MMKLIFENYRKHLQEQELNEISKEVYDYVMKRCEEKSLSFDNLFGKGTRVMIPAMRSSAQGMIGEIVRLFEDSGWKLNLKDSTVSREVATTIPKGPRAGEKVTQTKSMRIGKALERALSFTLKYTEANAALNKVKYSTSAMTADIMGLTGTSIEDDKETIALRKAIKQAEQKLEKPEKELKGFLPSSLASAAAMKERLPKLIKFWESNNGAQHYRDHPEEAYEKDPPLVMLSRHPIDVVRMSDMSGIRSCHSEDPKHGGYLRCAIAEACGHGPIALMIDRDEFEQYFGVDLDETDASEVDLPVSEEIFADDDRNISGMETGGRLRLRKFTHPDGRSIAVPETRTYAPGVSVRVGREGFVKGVKKWALEAQKDTIGDPNKLADEVYDEEWTRHGGSYEDTDDGGIFAALLEPVLSDDKRKELSTAGKMPKADPGETEESEIETDIDKLPIGLDKKAQLIQDEADKDLEHFSVWHDIEESDESEYVQYSGGFGFVLDEELGESPDGWELHKDAINDAVKQALDQEAYIYVQDSGEIRAEYDYQIHIAPAHDEYQDLDGFSSFVSSLISADDNFTAIMNNVRDQLQDAGIIPTTGESVTKTLNSLDKLRATINPEEKLIRVSWKDRDRIITQVADFKKYTAEEQDRIKKFFSVDFRNFIGDVLNRLRKKFDFPLRNIVLLRERQKLSLELDGVYSILDFDLKYEDNGEMRKASKMIEELNKGSYQMAIRKESMNAYYDAEKDVEKERRQMPPTTYQKMPAKEQEKSLEVDADARELNQYFESKKTKTSDKMLFESWRRYLGK
jgi:hypothetical protein